MDGDIAPVARADAASEDDLPLSAPVLVGRELERRLLRDELTVALGGHGRLVLVGGEAGIGKTTLARDLERVASEQGVRVLTGSCYDLTNTPPYGPWLDFFEQCRRDPRLPAPPGAFTGGRLAQVTDQAALFAGVRDFLTALTGTGPRFILFEDFHWADPASLDLLRHVGPHVRHWPLLLVVTYRADELTASRPLALRLPALARDADARRLDLTHLDADALRALVAARYQLNNVDEALLVRYLVRHAEGNPFFATELLRTLEEKELLRRNGDGWTLAAIDRVIVPSFLRQVIEARITRLGDAMRQPLAIAAVIGQDVPLALWAVVAGITEDALLDIVEQAAEAHLIEAERDGTRVHFVHALTREALYEGILPPRRRSWHQRVADALIASERPDPDAVAFHLQAAGDARAWEWLVRAGERARNAYAWLTAAQRFQSAAALLDGVDAEATTRGQIMRRAAYMLRFSDSGAAVALLDDAERLAARIGDEAMTAEVQWVRGIFLCYADRFQSGLASMTIGLSAIASMPDAASWSMEAIQTWFADAFPVSARVESGERARAVDRLRASLFHYREPVILWFSASAGYSATTAGKAERFLALLDGGPESGRAMQIAAAFASLSLGIADAALGQHERARQSFARSRELFREFEHHALVAISALTELRDVALPYAGDDPATRRRLAAEAEAALERAGGALRPGVSPRLAWLGTLLLDGRWREADALLRDLPDPRNAFFRREVTAARLALAHHQGDTNLAWNMIRSLLPAGSETDPGDINFQEGLALQRVAIELCLDAGDLPTAHAWLEAHDRWLAWGDGALGRADGRMAWAHYRRAAGDTARADALATDALRLASAPAQPLVRLAAHRLLGELATDTGDHAGAEAQLTAALHLADVCDAPFERASCLLALAGLRLATGARGEAASFLEEARGIWAPMDARSMLKRVDALAARLDPASTAAPVTDGLTQRELEVLRLLVAGRSNQAIADALFISRDTARTHVANIFRKLDVRTRTEAADYTHRHRLLSSDPPRST